MEQKHETKEIYTSHSATLRYLYFSVEKISSHFELLFYALIILRYSNAVKGLIIFFFDVIDNLGQCLLNHIGAVQQNHSL